MSNKDKGALTFNGGEMKLTKKFFLLLSLIFLATTIWANPTYFDAQTAGFSDGILGNSYGNTYISTQAAASTGLHTWYFRNGSSGGVPYGATGDNTDVTLAQTYSLTTPSFNRFRYNVGNTGYNYVFKSSNSSQFLLFEVQGAVRTISSVSRNHLAQGLDETMTVTATLSGTLNNGQSAYLRWTDDNWATSTVTTMSFSSGTSYTANIPTQTMSETVQYYVFTSGSSLTWDGVGNNPDPDSDAPLYTINYDDNGGDFYSYTVGRQTVSDDDWSMGSAWYNNTVPSAGDNVIIRNFILADGAIDITNLTIATGAELDMDGSTIDVRDGAILNNQGTYTHSGSRVDFNGAATVTGSFDFFRTYIYGAVDFGASASVEYQVRIYPGGSVVNNGPTYSTGCEIQILTGGTFNRGAEWATNSPYKIRIRSNTTYDLGAGGLGAITMNGDLEIDAGSAVVMNNGANDMVGSLTVGGNVLVGGTLSLSDASGGNLNVKGNFTLNAGTFNHNNRTVTLNGTSTQSIAGATSTLNFYNLTINNSTGVNLTYPVTVNKALALTSGVFNLGASTLSLAAGATVTGSFSSSRMIRVDSGGSLVQAYSTSNDDTALTFPIGSNGEYSPAVLTINSAGTTYGASPTVTFSVTPSVHPSNPAGRTDYLERYWTITNSNFTAIDYDIDLTYTDADIVGTEANLCFAAYNGSSWICQGATTPATNTLSATGLTSMSSFTGFNEDSPAFTMADDSSLTEGNEDAEVITVTLTSGEFVASLNSANWSIANAPTGVSLGSVSRVSNTVATVILSGSASIDYDANITNFTVTITNAEFINYSGSDISANSGVTFVATNDAETLEGAFVNGGAETSVVAGTESVDVTLTGGDFVTANVNGTNVTIDNTCSAYTTGIRLGGISNVTTTGFRVAIDPNGVADYDTSLTLTINVAGAAYNSGSATISLNVGLAATVEGVTFNATDDGQIDEGLENGEAITLAITGDTFNTSTPTTLQAAISILNGPTGCSVGAVTYTDDQNISFVISGNRTVDYDANLSNVEISIAPSVLTSATAAIVTEGASIAFIADDDAEAITLSDDGLLEEGAEDGEVITVAIQNGTYASSLNSDNWTVTNLPADVTWGGLTRVNNTTATFALSGNRSIDYDTDITNLTVQIATTEFDDTDNGASTVAISANSGVTFTANNDAESITLSSDGSIVEGVEDGEVITINLIGGTFVDPINDAQFSIANQPDGVSKGVVTRVNSTQVTIALSGDRTTDYDADITDFTVSIAADQIDDYSGADITANTGVTFTARVESITITENASPLDYGTFPIEFGDQPVNSDTDAAYTLNASGLSGDITITTPAGYSVSTTPFARARTGQEPMHVTLVNGQFVATIAGKYTRDTRNAIDVSPDANGDITDLTIYVRFSPTNTGAYTGDIAHTTYGLATQNVSVSGSSSTNNPAFGSTRVYITSILSHRAHVEGDITDVGNPAASVYGLVWGTSANPTIGAGNYTWNSNPSIGTFMDTAINLTANQTYYIRQFMYNGEYHYSPSEKTFTTLAATNVQSRTVNNGSSTVNFTVTPLAIDFSGVVGGGTDAITVDEVNGHVYYPGAAFNTASLPAYFSIVLTNNNGFGFSSANFKFDVSDFIAQCNANEGTMNQTDFDSVSNNGVLDITLWRRSLYSLNDMSSLGALRYSYGTDGTYNTDDDYLYYNGVTNFGEFAFTSDIYTLPVELSSFSAATANNMVSLSWVSQSETSMLGYYVYRSSTNSIDDAVVLTPNAIEALNNPSEQYYNFNDVEIDYDVEYRYWLQAVDLDATFAWYGPQVIKVEYPNDYIGDIQSIDKSTRLVGNYPNPFNPDTNISYNMEQPGTVSIKIYNTKGQFVKGFERQANAGKGSFNWDGRDSSGRSLSSGVYFYKMQAGKTTDMKKMIMLK